MHSKDNPDKRTGYWCGDCGAALRFNVPRLGPDSGFVHDETSALGCGLREEPDHLLVTSAFNP